MPPMPETIIRRCPRCGRKAHDHLLVQCPDCRVPFVYEEQPYTGLTPEQLQLVAAQIFGSWKFWAFLIIIVGAAAWGIVVVADRVIDARAKVYLSTLEQTATNRIGLAYGQISNQIVAEFKQPRIKSAMEQVARSRAGDIFTNGIRPSLESFQDALDAVTLQLAQTSNAIAKLQAEALAAKNRIPPPAPVAPPAPVVQQPTPAPSPAPAPPAAAASTVKLVLANRTVTQAGANYILTLFFRTVTTGNNPSSGVVEVMAGTYKQTAKILSFAAMTAGPTEPFTVNDTGDVARLRFAVSDREPPTLVLELSAPTIVRVVSDAFDADLTLPVAADRMQLPSASK